MTWQMVLLIVVCCLGGAVVGAAWTVTVLERDGVGR